MPNRCSAPGCRSNYSGETPTPVFKMPNGPPQLVSQWKSFLHRENVEDIKNVHVCLKHFHDEDVETHFLIPQPDGTNLEVKCSMPRLHRDAVPKLLPGCPNYLSVLSKKQTRLDRSTKERDQLDVGITLSLKQQQKDEERFKVSTFCELNSKVNNLTLPVEWLPWSLGMNQLNFNKPSISNMNGALVIECSLTIDESLCTKGFFNSNQVPVSIMKIQDLRDIENLLKELSYLSINNHNTENSNHTHKHHINDATKLLRLAVDDISKSEDDVCKEDNKLTAIQFIICQLENLLCHKHHRSYNIGTITPQHVINTYNHSTLSSSLIIQHSSVYIQSLTWTMNLVHFWKVLRPNLAKWKDM